MKRTNPKKGRDEDPALRADFVGRGARSRRHEAQRGASTGLTDASGYPRLAVSLGGAGTPQSYMGTFPAFLGRLGARRHGLRIGPGCQVLPLRAPLRRVLAPRLHGVARHAALNYLISCGANVEASGGVVGVWRHANARVRGMKRVQVEPHLSVTGACSAEWVPIKPKTDAAFLYALIHVLLHELPRERLDVPFLARHTASPYLVGPGGYYLRDRATRKPLVWERRARRGAVRRAGHRGSRSKADLRPTPSKSAPTATCWATAGSSANGLRTLVAHMAPYSPEWAEPICDVPAATMRRIAHEFVDHAHVGETIDIEGVRMPYRPVAVASARPSTTVGAVTSACGRARCSRHWSADSKYRAARSARRCGSTARCPRASTACWRGPTASWTIR